MHLASQRPAQPRGVTRLSTIKPQAKMFGLTRFTKELEMVWERSNNRVISTKAISVKSDTRLVIKPILITYQQNMKLSKQRSKQHFKRQQLRIAPNVN